MYNIYGGIVQAWAYVWRWGSVAAVQKPEGQMYRVSDWHGSISAGGHSGRESEPLRGYYSQQNLILEYIHLTVSSFLLCSTSNSHTRELNFLASIFFQIWANILFTITTIPPSFTFVMNSQSQEHVCHCGNVFWWQERCLAWARSCRTTKRILVGALSKAKDTLKTKWWWHHDLLLKPSPSEVRKSCSWDLEELKWPVLDWPYSRKAVWRCYYHSGEQDECFFACVVLFPSTCRFFPFHYNISCTEFMVLIDMWWWANCWATSLEMIAC